MFLKLALRNLFRNRARSLITLLMIGSGSMAMIIAAGFIDDTILQIREASIRDMLGHLRVYKHGFLQESLLRPYDFFITDPDPLIREISVLPHVVTVGPRLSYFGLIANGDTTLPFVMEAYDPARENRIQNTTLLVKGSFVAADKPYDMMLGKGLAQALHLDVGGSAVLVGNTQRGAMNASDATVTGIFRTISKDFDDRGIRAPIALAQKLLRINGAATLIIFLDQTKQTDSVAQALRQTFSAHHLDYDVQTWYEMPDASNITTTENVYRSIYRIMKIILFIFVILSIANTMNMAVLERVGEIGTMMAIGTPRRGILKLFLTEGIVMGIIGGLGGCLLGALGAILLSSIGIPMPNPPGSSGPWIARIALSPHIFSSAFVMALITSIISSVLPAMKASRMEVGEALRHNI